MAGINATSVEPLCCDVVICLLMARDSFCARRELRLLLEGVVKFSARDFSSDAKTFDERLAGLGDWSKRFEDYVSELRYLGDFEKPDEASAAILSLYGDPSLYVVPQAERFAQLQ